MAVPARRGHVEGRVAVKEAAGLSMNEGLRVSMGGYTWGTVAELRVAADQHLSRYVIILNET